MANKKWTGNALARAQVSTITVANTWATSDTGTVTINGKDLTLTVGAVTTTTGIAAAIAAMWNGDTAIGTETRSQTGDNVSEFSGITALASSATVILTGEDDGTPFTCTVSENTAGSGTLSIALTTAATSPHHWSDVDNWDAGAVPVTGVHEQQTVTVDATGGTFTITFGGQTTAATAFNAAAATLQANLEALSSIGSGNITVSGGPGAAGGGTPYTLTFKGTLGFQNVAQVTASGASLTGGAGTATPATTVAGSTGDDVYFENSDVDVLWDLSQSSIGLNSLNIAASYTGRIGLPDYDEGGFYEYRTKYLTLLGTTTLGVGYGPGAGSSRLKLNVGANLCTATIEKTASPAEDGLPALLLVGTFANNVLNASSGSIGVAVEMGQTSTLLTTRCGHQQAQASDVDLRLGSGCTLTTITQTGGELENNSALTTLTQYGGQVTLKGGGTIATHTVHGGTVIDVHTGTTTTLVVGSGAGYDLSRETRSKTFTNKVELYRGCKWADPYARASLAAGFQTVKCSVNDCDIDFGPNRSYTVS